MSIGIEKPVSNESKLNLKRSYGVVFGDSRVKYEQDGKYFGADLREIPKTSKPL